MQIRYLKTFRAVASSLSLTRAAKDVHLSQSSVTEQIQTLEAELGAILFDRSRHKLSLTEAGKCLESYAGDILALTDEMRAAVATAAGVAGGTLVIGGLETLCAKFLPPMLAKFSETYPDVSVQLKVDGSGGLRRNIRSGEMSVSFGFGMPVPDLELESEAIGEERLVIVVPPDHRLAKGQVVNPDDLLKENFLVTEVGCVYRQMFEDAFPLGRADRPRIYGEFGSLEAIRSLVKTGAGCALLPQLGTSGNDIIALPWNGTINTVPICMTWRRRRVQSPILRLFLEAVRANGALAKQADARHLPTTQSR